MSAAASVPIHILVVDDEEEIRKLAARELGTPQRRIRTAGTSREAVGAFKSETFDVVLLDLRLPDGSGMDLLSLFQDLAPEVQVIIMTAFADVDTAVQAMKLGAYDYIAKPFALDRLELIIEKAFQRTCLHRENKLLRLRQGEQPPKKLIGRSPAMAQVRFLIGKVAPTQVPVLLTGESGTGKTVAAEYLHSLSTRSQLPFITKNCGTFQKDLMRSELFGHRKGAFTGAADAQEGLLTFAHKGTLFMDEIGEVPPEVQSALLRVIENQTFRRLGEKEEQKVDVRFIFATNRSLQQEVEAGRFSQALYHRLNVFNIALPPLRERKEDIPELVDYFLGLMRRAETLPRITDRALRWLMAYDWPGNVREIHNVLERSLILSDGDIITENALPLELAGAPPATDPDSPFPPLNEIERRHIQAVLRHVNGSRSEAARILGIGRKTLYRKLKACDLHE